MSITVRRRAIALPAALGAVAATLIVARGEESPERPSHRPVVAAIAAGDAELASRAALAPDRARLLAVYRDARAATERARRHLSPSDKRLDALLAERARALTAVIEGRGDDAALHRLARTSARLRHDEGTRP